MYVTIDEKNSNRNRVMSGHRQEQKEDKLQPPNYKNKNYPSSGVEVMIYELTKRWIGFLVGLKKSKILDFSTGMKCRKQAKPKGRLHNANNETVMQMFKSNKLFFSQGTRSSPGMATWKNFPAMFMQKNYSLSFPIILHCY